jgi:hypothetical protein
VDNSVGDDVDDLVDDDGRAFVDDLVCNSSREVSAGALVDHPVGDDVDDLVNDDRGAFVDDLVCNSSREVSAGALVDNPVGDDVDDLVDDDDGAFVDNLVYNCRREGSTGTLVVDNHVGGEGNERSAGALVDDLISDGERKPSTGALRHVDGWTSCVSKTRIATLVNLPGAALTATARTTAAKKVARISVGYG